MNIFVCVKQVPHENCEIAPEENGCSIEEDEFVWIINPEDECAVEQALQIRDEKTDTTVVALGVGLEGERQEALIAALAMGVDAAVHIQTHENLDPYRTAKALAGAIKSTGKAADMVLCGNTSYDSQNQQVPQTLAQMMGLPVLTRVSEFLFVNGQMQLRRQKEGGLTEVYEVAQPLIVACAYGLNVPRYAPLPHIKRAEKTPLIQMTLEGVGVKREDQRLKYFNLRLPVSKAPGEPFDAREGADLGPEVERLVERLRQDIKQFANKHSNS